MNRSGACPGTSDAMRSPETPTALRVTEGQWTRIRSELLKACEREHHLFALLGRSGEAFTLRKLIIPGEDDYEIRAPDYVALSSRFVLRVLRQYQNVQAAGLLDLHSHPFQKRADFSSTDRRFFGRMVAHAHDRVHDGTLITGVLGSDEDGFALESHSSSTGMDSVDGPRPGSGVLLNEVEVVGRRGARRIRSWLAEDDGEISTADGSWLESYERNAELRTEEENNRVARARVAIVGAGGIGSEMARLISLLGVRDVALIDPDRIEKKNLNRLMWATPADEGLFKVERLAEVLRAHDPGRAVSAIAAPFPSKETVAAVAGADIVLVGVDSDRARFDVLRLCVRHLRPAVDAGTAVYLDENGRREATRAGHVWAYLPGSRRCWLDMGLDGPGLWDPGLIETRRNAGYVVDLDQGAAPGSVQTLNTLTAAVAVQVAEQILMGRDPGPAVIQLEIGLDGPMKTKLRTMKLAEEPECPLCGEDGFEGEGGSPFRDEHNDPSDAFDLPDLPVLEPAPTGTTTTAGRDAGFEPPNRIPR